MEIPKRFIEAMTSTSSADIWWLSPKDSWSLHMPPSIAEWMAASCGAMRESERTDILLTGEKHPLWKKFKKIEDCKFKKLINARKAIAID
jgi:hypothetical protein